MIVSPQRCCEVCGCPLSLTSGLCPRRHQHADDPTETEILAMCRELREKRKAKPEPDKPVEIKQFSVSELVGVWKTC